MKSITRIIALLLVALMIVLAGCGAETNTPVAESFTSSGTSAEANTDGAESASESTQETAAQPAKSTAAPGRIAASDLPGCATRAELAEMLGCSVDELDDFILYAKNLNTILPDTDEAPEIKSEYPRGLTDDGFTWVLREELKPLVSAVVITKDNWKDYFAPATTQIEVWSYDENDNEVVRTEDDFVIAPPSGYYYDSMDCSLTMINNATGNEFEFSGSWPEQIVLENGKYYCITYDKNWKEVKAEFDPDNYTCIKADMVLYKYEIEDDLLCCERYDEETGEWLYFKYSEAPEEFPKDYTYVCINMGTEDEPDIWQVGLGAVGRCVLGRDN